MLLYHNPISSCSQKVRMALHEKGLAYEGKILDLQKGDQFNPDYIKLNPNAVVPTLDDNGAVFIESTLINEYIDDAYPQNPLKPKDAGERHRMRLFTKKIDEKLHPACGAMTFAIGARPGLMARPEEERDALINAIPDPIRRNARRSVIENGVFAPEVKAAMDVHSSMFDTADALLSDSDWLAGEEFSLADCALIPYTLRMDHLSQGGLIESRKNLTRWYNAIRERPAFEAAVSAWLPEPLVKVFNQAGNAVADDLAKVMAG